MDAVLATALAVFTMVALTAAACTARPTWRRHLPVAAPVVLGIACLAGAAALINQFPAVVDQGVLRAWAVAGAFNSLAPALLAGVLAILLTRAAFWGEHGLIGLLRRSTGPRVHALPAELLSLNLPGRAETMRAVSRTARFPVQFWGLSILTVVGEELFFRVAMPAALMVAGFPAWVAVVVPASAYAANHLGFGAASVAGKFLLGLVLGAGAWAGGAALASIPAHLLYQRWVQRQFIRLPARSRHDRTTLFPWPRPRT